MYGAFNEGSTFKYAYDSCTLPTYDSGDKDFEKISKDLQDGCGLDDDGVINKDCYENGTGWTFIWFFNAITMIAQSLNFMLMTCGSWWFWPRVLGTFMSWVLGLASLFAVYLSFESYQRDYTDFCKYNIAVSEYDDNSKFESDGYTYKDDYDMIGVLMLGSLSCGLLQLLCCWVPCYMTPTGAASANKPMGNAAILNGSDFITTN